MNDDTLSTEGTAWFIRTLQAEVQSIPIPPGSLDLNMRLVVAITTDAPKV
jgi:hypothetical protein